MFEIDVQGLAELEGGMPPHRLAFEPVANVFDEFRGYETGPKRPNYCTVTLTHSSKPRGVVLSVADDGAGFTNERDIWTLFGSTPKRTTATVSGRFNEGDKQLIALSRRATVKTNNLIVTFAEGQYGCSECEATHTRPSLFRKNPSALVRSFLMTASEIPSLPACLIAVRLSSSCANDRIV